MVMIFSILSLSVTFCTRYELNQVETNQESLNVLQASGCDRHEVSEAVLVISGSKHQQLLSKNSQKSEIREEKTKGEAFSSKNVKSITFTTTSLGVQLLSINEKFSKCFHSKYIFERSGKYEMLKVDDVNVHQIVVNDEGILMLAGERAFFCNGQMIEVERVQKLTDAGPCPSGYHFLTAVGNCVSCTGTSEYLNFDGSLCLDSCAADQFIWSAGLKICTTGLLCPGQKYAVSTSNVYALQCVSCTISKTLNNFCVVSCKEYYDRPDGCAALNATAGSCNLQFVTSAGDTCTATCDIDPIKSLTAYIFSDNGDKVCGLTNCAAQFNVLDQSTLKMTCAECSDMKLGDGDIKFCVYSCRAYSENPNGCASSTGIKGNCNLGYMTSTTQTCRLQCDPDNTANQKKYIYTDRGDRICQIDGCGTNMYITNIKSLQCSCMGDTLGSFCVPTCNSYYTAANGCNSKNVDDGNCALRLSQNDKCIKPNCENTQYISSSYKCIDCKANSEFADSNGIFCLETCDTGFVYDPNGIKVCYNKGLDCSATLYSLQKDTKNSNIYKFTCAANQWCDDTLPQYNLLNTYCIDSCIGYFNNPKGCNLQSATEPISCSTKYLDTYFQACVAPCQNFIFSTMGELLCPDNEMPCSGDQLFARGRSPGSLSDRLVCRDKIQPEFVLKSIGSKYFVRSCVEYFKQTNGCKEQIAADGYCNAAIEEKDACIVITKIDVAGGDSGSFGTCSKGLYLLNYVCISCDQPNQFVDQAGYNCIATCKDYVYSISTGLKICSDSATPCMGSDTWLVVTDNSNYYQQLQCDSCLVSSGKYVLGKYCSMINCKAYNERSNACWKLANNDKGLPTGQCDKEYAKTIEATSQVSCVSVCDNDNDYIFSINGDKVCGLQTCTAGQFNIMSQPTLQQFCSPCTTPNKQLGNKYCVPDCYQYFMGASGCMSTNAKVGWCNSSFDNGDICVNVCPAKKFVQSIHCVDCTKPTEYVDYQGKLCIDNCVTGKFMYTNDGLKVCSEGQICDPLKQYFSLVQETYSYDCSDCSGKRKLNNWFCLSSCLDYATKTACKDSLDKTNELCNQEFVASTGDACTAVCGAFIWSATGEKVCGKTDCAAKFNVMDATSLAMTCADCTNAKLVGQLQIGFCVSTCNDYYQMGDVVTAKGCKSTPNVDAGQCAKQLQDYDRTCVVLAQKCTPGYYYKTSNYQCVRCNQATEYINYDGITCLDTCAAADVIFTSSGAKMCSTAYSSCATTMKVSEALVAQGLHFTLTCGACTPTEKIINAKFCVASCMIYAASIGCVDPINNANKVVGYCKYQFFASDGGVCIDTCSDFIYSTNGEKICGKSDCPGGQVNLVDLANLKITCLLSTSCATVTTGTTIKYCIDSCKTYFQYTKGCNTQLSAEGQCNLAIEEEKICIATSKMVNLPQGTSDGFYGCKKEYYLKDYKCVECSTDSEYADDQGVNCIASCPEGSYIYAKKVKICKSPSATCTSAQAWQVTDVDQTSGQIKLSCVSCTAADKWRQLNGFCIANCNLYAAGDKCMIDSKKGNCNLGLAQTSGDNVICVATCTEFIWSAANEKVCPAVGCSGKNTLDQVTHKTTCSPTCEKKTLSAFCVDVCKTYYLDRCKPAGELIVDGNCNRPIEQDNVCIVAQKSGVVSGDSGYFKGCTNGKYLKDYVCIACTDSSQYVDQYGYNCVLTCASHMIAKVIPSTDNVKICAGTDCVGLNKYSLKLDATLLTYSLECKACPIGEFALDKFCIASCKSYYSTECASSNTATGNCDKLYYQTSAAGDQVSCTTGCTKDYIITAKAEKICPISGNCASGYNNYDATTLKTTCVSCTDIGMVQLGKFCTVSCKSYFIDICSKFVGVAGLCNMPIEQDSVCIVPITPGLADGTDGGCTTGAKFLNDYKCRSCDATSGEWVDYKGQNCILTSCSDFVYTSNGLKLCRDNFVCPDTKFASIMTGKVELECLDSCGANQQLNKFCVSGCAAYFSDAKKCNNIFTAVGNCQKRIEDAGICIDAAIGCPAGKFNKSSVCDTCKGANDYVKYNGLDCIASCAAANFVYNVNGWKVCNEGLTCPKNQYKLSGNSLLCADCSTESSLINTNGKFCMASCINYFNQANGCNGAVNGVAAAGNCNAQLVELKVCKPINPGCSTGRFIDSNSECILCNGPSEYVKYDGIYCQTTCNLGFIYNADGLKICKDGKDCAAAEKLKLTSVSLACVPQADCTKIMGLFCTTSCDDYFTAAKGCNSKISDAGQCKLRLDEAGTCVEACKATNYLKSNLFCVSCLGTGEYRDPVGMTCSVTCNKYILTTELSCYNTVNTTAMRALCGVDYLYIRREDDGTHTCQKVLECPSAIVKNNGDRTFSCTADYVCPLSQKAKITSLSTLVLDPQVKLSGNTICYECLGYFFCEYTKVYMKNAAQCVSSADLTQCAAGEILKMLNATAFECLTPVQVATVNCTDNGVATTLYLREDGNFVCIEALGSGTTVAIVLGAIGGAMVLAILACVCVKKRSFIKKSMKKANIVQEAKQLTVMV